MSPRTLALLTLLAVLAFVASPLIVTGFNGFTPGQFPIPQVDPPVQPKAIAFSIWGLIYAWLVAGSVFGLWKAAEDPDWAAMRPWLALSTGLGAFWLPLAQVAVVPATVLIFVMLGTAALAMLRAGRRDAVWQVRPVALYTGWLTAASGVSVGLFLAGYGWMGQTAAAIVALLLVLAMGLAIHFRRPAEWAYPAALIWALSWVVARNLQPLNLPVAGLAAVMVAALVVLMLRGVRRA